MRLSGEPVTYVLLVLSYSAEGALVKWIASKTQKFSRILVCSSLNYSNEPLASDTMGNDEKA
jgi:hypothetical protein